MASDSDSEGEQPASSRFVVHDISHLIPPPVPLMPRLMYADDSPKSYLSLL